MEQYSIIPGRVAQSTAGRDKGNLYIIASVVDKEFVTVADGGAKTLAKPKKKRLKHLKLREEVAEAISEKLMKGSKVFDSEIRSSLNKIENNNR